MAGDTPSSLPVQVVEQPRWVPARLAERARAGAAAPSLGPAAAVAAGTGGERGGRGGGGPAV